MTSVWWPIHLVSALRCKVVAGDAVRSGQGAHFITAKLMPNLTTDRLSGTHCNSFSH